MQSIFATGTYVPFLQDNAWLKKKTEKLSKDVVILWSVPVTTNRPSNHVTFQMRIHSKHTCRNNARCWQQRSVIALTCLNLRRSTIMVGDWKRHICLFGKKCIGYPLRKTGWIYELGNHKVEEEDRSCDTEWQLDMGGPSSFITIKVYGTTYC